MKPLPLRALLASRLPLLILLAAGLPACAGAQRVDYHLTGGGLAFAEGQELSRADAQAVVDEVARRTADPEYQDRVLQAFADRVEAWSLDADDGYTQLDLAWHPDVVDESRPEDGYAAHRATSAPAEWFAFELPQPPPGAVVVRLEAVTALSPAEPGYTLALVPQAACLAFSRRSMPGELAREALLAVRETQLELVRAACAARGLRLFEGG